MRKEVARVYAEHFKTFEAQVETLVAVMEARATATARPMPVDWRAICDAEPQTYNCECC